MQSSKVKGLVVNALIAALYVILAVGPGMFNLASGAIQFRLSEGLNHLVAFDRRYLGGVLLGVIIFNALFSPMGWLDVLFGGGQTLIGLGLAAWLAPHLKHLWQKMALTTATMTLTMALITVEIVMTGHLGAGAFLGIYGSLMLSELLIMAITAPVMMMADRMVRFKQVIN